MVVVAVAVAVSVVAAVAIVLNSYRLIHIFCGSLSACHTQKKKSNFYLRRTKFVS